MPRLVGTISGDGFESSITEDNDGRVWFYADADIDADGANGQHGAKVAYMSDNSGSEHLAYGGMQRVDGKVICAHDWARSIVILGADNEPKEFSGGVIASKTWYRYPGKSPNDPTAYVDSQTISYIVVPPIIIKGVSGIVCGCKARATLGGKSIDCVVADRGPAKKIGELSIAAADALGIPSSPRNGGREKADILYELWPDVAAPGFELIPA